MILLSNSMILIPITQLKTNVRDNSNNMSNYCNTDTY